MQKEIFFSSDLREKSDEVSGVDISGGKMRALINAKDWSNTALGPMREWPQRLRLALDICLKSNSPISLFWGSDFTLLYNDAWSELIDNEPMLGKSAADVFKDDWQFIGSELKKVFLEGEAVELRNQFMSLTGRGKGYFNLSLSPIGDSDGSADGIFNIAAETTGQVKTEKRRRDIEKAFQIETVGVAFFNMKGEITEANSAFLRMSGFDREDIDTGKLRWDELTPPEWESTTERAIKELTQTGTSMPYEKEYYRKDGSRWWALFSAKYLEDGNCVEFVLDITKRKRAEKLEEEQKKLLELIVSGVPLEECFTSLCSTVSRLNSGVRAAILLSDDQHKDFNRPITSDFPDSFEEGLNGESLTGTCGEAILTGKPAISCDIENDERWSKKWRDLCLAHGIRASHSEPLFDKRGRTVGAFMLCFDEPRKADDWEQRLVSFGTHIAGIALEGKRSEEKTRQSEEKYRRLFEFIDEGFCIIQMMFDENNMPIDYRFLEANPAFEEETGLNDVKGKTMRQLIPNHDAHWFEIYGKVALTGKPRRFEAYAQELERWFNVYAFRIAEGQEHKVALIFTNITERKEVEERLRSMNEMLEERVEERTESLLSYQNQLRSLASRLSKAEEHVRQRLAAELHDNLGQILAVGKMKVDLLQKAQLNDQVAADVGEVKELVNDALTYTRALMSDLKPPPSLNKEDIRATIEWLADKMKKHDLDVTLVDDGKPKMGSEEIRITLLQCVRELLFNVIKHSGVHEARIIMSYSDQQIEITVEDAGKGFDLAANKLASTKEGGFGLFNISERVDLIGGSVDISTAPGKGTKVKLVTPLKVGSESTESVPDAKTESRSKSTDVGKKVKVLLVDDHEMMRKGLRKIVDEQEDLTVIAEASDGKEAIELAEEASPDVIVMDVNMPGMNGIEATQEIMSKEPKLRVIGLSLHNHKNVIESMRQAGASAYLTKNEAFETLCATIRSEAALAKE